MTARELRKYRKENGLCVNCGNPLDGTGVLCESCREKKHERERNNYRYYQSIHVCPRCHKNKLYGDEKKCPECRAKEAESAARRRRARNSEDRAAYLERRKVHNKRYREALKEKGLCVSCGKRKVEAGHTYCRYCRDKKSEAQRIANGVPLGGERNYRASHGLCYYCGRSPCVEGKKLCKACYDKAMANLAKTREINAKRYWHR